MISLERQPISCRIGCGACCIAPSISSAIPGMPEGKKAGVRCFNLDASNLCRLWGTSQYPAVCAGFVPQRWVCGETRDEALSRISELDRATTPT